MSRLRSTTAIVAAMVLAVACSDSPTAPAPVKPVAVDPANSVITPFLLPPGADWGLYFVSFNRDRNLTARVIHYPWGVVTGDGQFLIPGGKSGVFHIYSAAPYGGCVPNGIDCAERNATKIPESANVTGFAFFYTGGGAPIAIDLHSNFWPNATNTYDTATLRILCGNVTCPLTYSFFGELHHEPL